MTARERELARRHAEVGESMMAAYLERRWADYLRLAGEWRTLARGRQVLRRARRRAARGGRAIDGCLL